MDVQPMATGEIEAKIKSLEAQYGTICAELGEGFFRLVSRALQSTQAIKELQEKHRLLTELKGVKDGSEGTSNAGGGEGTKN